MDLKNRYVAFRTFDNYKYEEIKKEIYQRALDFFGILHLSDLSLKLIEYEGNTGILRCKKDHVRDVEGFLALNKSPRTKYLATSGTIKGLREKL